MDTGNHLMPGVARRGGLVAALQQSNALAARYGLALTEPEMRMLAQRQVEVLRETGRIEFDEGPYGKLVYAFCDSPYLSRSTYAETLAELCGLFYRFKGESGERWSDDELIEAMKRLFDGSCQGSTDLVGDRLWQHLHEPEPMPLEQDDEEEWDGQ